MKVYVIKNKEGKYWNVIYGFRDDISRATIEPYPNKMKLQKDEYWQEATLCEGDLEKELEVYKKALRLAVLTQCTKSRQDLINQICKFTFTAEVYEFFINQARKELEEKDVKD